jgi:integrase
MVDLAKTSIIPHTYDNITVVTESPRVQQLRQAVRSPNTRRAYLSNWHAFEAWCDEQDLEPLLANEAMVADYLAHLAAEGCAPSSIARAYSALLATLREVSPDLWPPGIRPHSISEVLRGIRRESSHKVTRKRPLTDAEVSKIVSQMGSDLRGLRNRALLLVGVMGAFRRSELVGLDVEGIQVVPEGLHIALPRSKTDQEGEGRAIGIRPQKDESRCPVHALARWIEAAGITEGPVFRPIERVPGEGDVVMTRRLVDKQVARVVKAAVASIGLDVDDFSGHSLRSGFVTTAARQGRSLDAIMRQTGHRSVAQVMEYIRHATVFVDNATEDFMRST